MAENELFAGLPKQASPVRNEVGGGVRVRQPERHQVEWRSFDLDGLLAADHAAEVIGLTDVVQDGVRVRASAGSSSVRRRQRLHKHLKKARRLVEHLKREVDEDPEASNRRIKAAQERAAREREQRVSAALGKLAELDAERERRAKTNKKQVKKQKEPKASTTDAEARTMKVGGWRLPAGL